LSSPRFHNLFKYAWFKSGYIEERPPHFENPQFKIELCFSGKDIQEIPRCSICGAPSIIRCSWCKKYFCMQHFFEGYHDFGYYEIIEQYILIRTGHAKYFNVVIRRFNYKRNEKHYKLQTILKKMAQANSRYLNKW
ncbi:hypothetical protein X777_01174, partial [Ooceraea biroi]